MADVLKQIVIDVIIYYVAPYLSPFLTGIGVSAEVAKGVVTALRVGAVLRGLAAVATALGPHAPAQLYAFQTSYAGTVAPRVILYGTNKIGGVEVIPPFCSGNTGTMLHEVLCLAGHKCSAISDTYFFQDQILSANIAAVTGASGDGLVTAGKYANNAWIRRYSGSQTVVDFILNAAFAIWDSSKKGIGLTYVALTFKYNTTLFPNGKPAVSFIVAGKICYDPRLDTSPGANPTNPAYAAFTSNPALCITDYIIDQNLGVGESPSNVDWTLVVAAANKCDENVAVPGGNQTRYTCNCALDCTARFEDNLALLALSMMGTVIYSGGKWRMFAGSWQTPSFALGNDDVVGRVDYQTAIAYTDRYNAVRGQFYDIIQNFQPVEYSPIRVSADETADGDGVLWKEANFPCCHYQFEAQRNAIILQRFSRRKKTWILVCGMSAWGIRCNDTGTLTLSEWGLVAQTVRCISWAYDPAGTVQLTLQEVNSADWNDPSTGTYVAPGTSSLPSTTPYTPSAPTALTAAGGPNAIGFVWQDLNFISTDTFILLESPVNNIASAVVVHSGQTLNTVLTKADQVTRYYWVYVANQNGQVSSTFPAGATSGVAAAANAIAAGQMGTGSVDPTTGVVLSKGSTTQSVPDGTFSYTSTTTTVNISWGAIVVYRSDGTSATITSGNQTVTGLVANQTYYSYAYAVDNGTGTLTMAFVTGSAGSIGTPQICWNGTGTTAQLAALAAGSYLKTGVPLDRVTTVTPSSGSGGGGGGGGAGCLHPEQLIETAEGEVRASTLRVGDLLLTNGSPVPIARLTHPLVPEWIEFGFSSGTEVKVTPSHLFVRADGDLVAARDLHLGEILTGGGGRNVEVLAMRLLKSQRPCVSLELNDPHLYLISRKGPLSHNPKP